MPTAAAYIDLLMQVAYPPAAAASLLNAEDSWIGAALEPLLSRRIGGASYSTGSLFNHSCSPNVKFRFPGQVLVE